VKNVSNEISARACLTFVVFLDALHMIKNHPKVLDDAHHMTLSNQINNDVLNQQFCSLQVIQFHHFWMSNVCTVFLLAVGHLCG